jgi:quercetin dioxygenase-like cupin family protein
LDSSGSLPALRPRKYPFQQASRGRSCHGTDLSVEGRETIQTRVVLAPGAVAPWHSHPGEELIYVLEGRLEFQLQGEIPVQLEAGDVLFVPARKVNMARNSGATPGVGLATYTVEKGKPLLVRAEAPTQ